MQVMTSRKLALAAIASAFIMTACGDSNLLRATLPTVNDFYSIYALSGTPAAYPSGINTYVRQPVRVDGNANFDIAFDLDASGNAIVYPVQKIVSSLSASRRVGLRKVGGTFESVTIAPPGVYADSAAVLAPGEIVIVQAVRNGSGDACQFNISPYIYTKLRLESVDLDNRIIVLQTVLDPNCGFRSFEAGIPSN
jgi:hypothetical protein